MNLDEVFVKPSQPVLFDLGETSSGVVELFPGVWHLCEGLISADIAIRRSSVEQLLGTQAARLLPMVAYILATRITEPDFEIRAKVVYLLGEILLPDEQGRPAADSVRQSLNAYLAQIRTRQIYAMLQLLPRQPDLEPGVARLLNACPYAGNQLADILSSRKVPLDIRRYAVRMIGLVGYLDAIPALERQLARLETRLHGQQSLAFAPVDMVEDAALIPDIRRALAFLQSP